MTTHPILGREIGRTLAPMPEALRSAEQYRLVTYSLLLIVLMLTRPQGLFGRSEFSWARVFPRKRELLEG